MADIVNKREILFRGKRRNNGEWVYGLPQYDSGGGIGRICGWMGDEGDEKYAEVEIIGETLGQQVGNIYYNGDEIPFYEGDIVYDIYKEEIGVVTFDYDKWVVMSKKRPVYIGSCSDWIKIGTIHENPELLNK